MALKAATAPRATVDEDNDEVPQGIPRHAGNQRPKIRHADDPTKMSYWPRASSFAERVQEMFVLDRHNERLVARGMAISPDLCELVASLAGLDERGDKDEATRIANLAKTAAGGDRKANRGTALHRYRERYDRGEDLAFLGPQQWAALQAWIRLMEPFEQYASETFVVNDRWRVAGSFDVLLGLKPGYELVAPDRQIFTHEDRLLGDLKSGNHIDELGALERAIQQVIYAWGRPYEHVGDNRAGDGENGRLDWPIDERLPYDVEVPPSRTWSLIPHVPLEHPEDAALWWVDLTKAAAIADVVAQLHELRKTDGLIVPAEPPKLVEPTGPAAAVLSLIPTAESELHLTNLWTAYQDVWTDEHTAAVKARLAELSALDTEIRSS